MPTPGVITEQGFVAGEGLGFNPLSEQDREKVQYGKEDNWTNHTNDSAEKESGF